MVAEILGAANLAASLYIVHRVKPRIKRTKGAVVVQHRPAQSHDVTPTLTPDESGARFKVIGVNPKGVRHPGSYIGNDAKRANAAWDAFRHEHDIKGRFTFADSQHPGAHRGDFVRD